MAFSNLTTLVQRTIVRLRQVSGQATQLYSQDEVTNLLRETYQMVRKERYWDHLMRWTDVQLDGTTGMPTSGFDGTTEGFEDIRAVYYADNSVPLPQLTANVNPYHIRGTYPRFVEPLASEDDVTLPRRLFRVWPLEAVTTVNTPLRVRYRRDPVGLFSDPSVVVPFDDIVLVNGAAARYLAQDATTPGGVADLNTVFSVRMEQLTRAHDNATIMLDPRYATPGLTEWAEDWR